MPWAPVPLHSKRGHVIRGAANANATQPLGLARLSLSTVNSRPCGRRTGRSRPEELPLRRLGRSRQGCRHRLHPDQDGQAKHHRSPRLARRPTRTGRSAWVRVWRVRARTARRSTPERVARVVRPWAWLRGMEVGWRVGSSLLKINLLKLRSVLLCEIHLKNVQSRVL